MNNLFFIGIGGGIGAITRSLLDQGINRLFKKDFPLGTLGVNFLGLFFIGIFYSHLLRNSNLEMSYPFFVTGFLGGLTTFSSYILQSLQLFQEERYKAGVGNFLLNNLLGLVVLYLGYLI